MKLLYLIIAIDFILAAVVGASIIRMILNVSYKNQLFDMPDARKVHKTPVPRLGGMSFMPVLMIVIAFSVGVVYRTKMMNAPEPDGVLIIRLSFMLGSAMLLYVVGLLDDLTGMGYKVKFLVQFLASALLVSSGLWLNSFFGLFGIERIPFYIGMPFTVFLLVLIINAINLIDGIDGLSSSLVMITLGLLLFISLRERRFIYSTVSVTMLGAVFAFWLFNLFGSAEKKTKLYMGDTGALTLGLVICFLLVSLCYFPGRHGMITSGKYFTIVCSSLLIPILEVPRLIISRMLKGKSPFEADANHIHHRLMRCGLSARKTLAIIVALDVFIVVLTAGLTRLMGITPIFFIDILMYLLIQFVISKNIKYSTLPKES